MNITRPPDCLSATATVTPTPTAIRAKPALTPTSSSIRTDISWASGNPSRPVIRLNGQGAAEIFQNGKYIRGSWARDCSATKNLKNRMVFFDENGEELPMKVGKTFIRSWITSSPSSSSQTKRFRAASSRRNSATWWVRKRRSKHLTPSRHTNPTYGRHQRQRIKAESLTIFG
ncbi:MAG: DUF3048 C-terminal domain-containing protein [Christensenellales bacterium]